MSEDILQEIENRMKEIETAKTELWEKGQYDPMMEGEYWDCQIVLRQMQNGENVDISDLHKKKHDGVIAAEQQVYKIKGHE